MIDENTVFAFSQQIVVREIEGELVIIPLSGGIADMEEQLYSLNETGQAIWEKIDGKRSVKEIAEALSEEYQEDVQKIRMDVFELIREFQKRDFLRIIAQ